MKNSKLHPVFEEITKPLQPKEKTLEETMDNCINNLDKAQEAMKGFYIFIQDITGTDNKLK